MSFADTYIYFCSGSFVISCLFNAVLIYVVHQRQERVGFYRFFTYAFVIVDVLYSFAFSAVQPFWYAGPGMLGFFSIAPWSSDFTLIRIAFQLWFVTFVLVLLCISCSFAYRYGLLCSPQIVSMFEVPQRFVATLLLLLVYGIFWLHNSNYRLLAESQAVRQILQEKFSAEYHVDLLTSYELIVDINDEVFANQSITGTIICIIMMQSQIAMMVFCGWKIHQTIKERTMSGKLKKIHGRALSMLISQALNPMMFLYTPSFIIMFGMFTNADFGDLPKALAMLLAFFPIVNPIIIIYFTEDYKRFLLRNGPVSGTQTSVVVSRAYDSHRG